MKITDLQKGLKVRVNAGAREGMVGTVHSFDDITPPVPGAGFIKTKMPRVRVTFPNGSYAHVAPRYLEPWS